MTRSLTPTTFAAGAMALSALLHFLAPIFAGFHADALLLIVPGLVLAALAWGVWPGRRRVAWIAFLAVLVGFVLSVTAAAIPSAVPAWIYLGIAACDALAATALFVVLWRNPDPSAV